MTKINNNQLIQRTSLKPDKFYRLKKQYPELIVLAKKGLVAETVMSDKIFDEMIKKDNIVKDTK